MNIVRMGHAMTAVKLELGVVFVMVGSAILGRLSAEGVALAFGPPSVVVFIEARLGRGVTVLQPTTLRHVVIVTGAVSILAELICLDFAMIVLALSAWWFRKAVVRLTVRMQASVRVRIVGFCHLVPCPLGDCSGITLTERTVNVKMGDELSYWNRERIRNNGRAGNSHRFQCRH